MERVFESVLAPYFEGYLNLRKSSNMSCSSHIYMLKQFDKFAANYGLREPVITKNLIEAWHLTLANDAPYTISHKYSAWANVARYMQGLGIQCYIAKNPTKVRSREGFVPYIFNKEEINLMLDKSCTLRCNCEYYKVNGLIAFPTIIRVLYSTGVRIGECLGIRNEDIDWGRQFMLVRNTKSSNERIVPICKSLLEVMKEYQIHRDNVLTCNCKTSEYFFVKNNGKRLSHTCMAFWFQELLKECHIPIRGDGFGPRVHDLRHTFAVHSLKGMVENGMDLFMAFSILSATMGHKNLRSTEYYIRTTAAEYPEIAKLTEKLMSKIYPTIEDEEN